MEVILREDIDKLGNRGEVVKVASGYARNFLIPKRLAVAATDSNKKIVEQERQAHLRKEAKQQGKAQDLAKLLNGVSVTIAQKAGENDQLFGSVTSKDVADAHMADVKTQGKYGVQYLRYWFDEKNGKIFCLVDAPNADAANRVHKEARGLVADEIYPVTEGM